MIKKRKRIVPFLAEHLVEKDFFEKLWDESWIYVKTVVNTENEALLILDKDFFVIAANQSFYETFEVMKEATEGIPLYRLGNGQWSDPSLLRLLTELSTKQKSFKGFEVAHKFPTIGNKVMLLNARKMYYRKDSKTETFLPVIVLAFEDISELVSVAQSFAKQLSHQQE